jgi:hypothetical protein
MIQNITQYLYAMKTKLLLSILFFGLATFLLTGQVPQGFNYQAIARDGTGAAMVNQTILVKVSVLTDTLGFKANGTGTYLWEEQHSVTTSNTGIFSLVVGTKTKIQGSAASFDKINWSSGEKFIGIKLQYQSGSWKNMGTSKLNSIPYAMVSDKAMLADKALLADEAKGVTSGTKLSVTSKNDAGTEALFEVKRADGQTVFAVYPDAVNVYVPRSVTGKGSKGGFAIGGFDGSKLGPQDYFRVTPDSVRVYIDPTPTVKGSKGGFAIGGYGEAKGGINSMYFNLTGATAVNTVAESPQILWYPIKKAFLAGSVHIGAVDSVGQNSTALGYRSIAMGNFSQAFGFKAKAFGDFSTSIGKLSVAGARSGGVSTASNAFAFGDAAKALGANSIAFGTNTQATVTNAIAIGNGSTASGASSMAFGNTAQATNGNALAMGNGTIASGTNSTAIGYQSQSQGDKSIAIGSYYSYSYYIPRIVLAKGGGSATPVEGTKGIDVFLPVRPITLATTFLRTYNRANIASGQYSVAIGNGNLAQNGGFVFGSNSDAMLFGALSLGNSAHANEANSTAIGYETISNGVYSVSIGNNVTAPSYGEIALGQWNEAITGTKDSWNENELLFSLGNGTSSTDRSNALTIYKDGKTNIMGRYASTTFNYKYSRLVRTGTFPYTFIIRDYVYGVYSTINRDDPAIEYYYSGFFTSTGTSGTYYGEYADTRSGGAIDVAEYIYDTKANTEAADVVVADAMNKESVIKSTIPFQSSVVGVISTKPHMTMGMELVIDEKTGEPLKNAKPATRLALSGRVPVKVCGENGNIVPGDYLTTSSNPGTAMKWTLLDVNAAKDFDDLKRILSENEKRRNAIIGKAVESFSGNGTGKIVVLISLQ